MNNVIGWRNRALRSALSRGMQKRAAGWDTSRIRPTAETYKDFPMSDVGEYMPSMSEAELRMENPGISLPRTEPNESVDPLLMSLAAGEWGSKNPLARPAEGPGGSIEPALMSLAAGEFGSKNPLSSGQSSHPGHLTADLGALGQLKELFGDPLGALRGAASDPMGYSKAKPWAAGTLGGAGAAGLAAGSYGLYKLLKKLRGGGEAKAKAKPKKKREASEK